jgi:hypothetical protein
MAFSSGPIQAFDPPSRPGTSDVRINGGNDGIGIIPVPTDLEIIAGGNIDLTGTVRARDVALDAGGTVRTQIVQADDDIVIRAGADIDTGALTSGSSERPGPSDPDGAGDRLARMIIAGTDITNGGTIFLDSRRRHHRQRRDQRRFRRRDPGGPERHPSGHHGRRRPRHRGCELRHRRHLASAPSSAPPATMARRRATCWPARCCGRRPGWRRQHRAGRGNQRLDRSDHR